jgi:predicted CoA-binding protein
MNVVVLGASGKEHRYSNMAVKRLKDNGHNVFPVHATAKEVHGIPVYGSLPEIRDQIHTISVYVSKENSDKIADDILNMKPKRIIFNPGAENYDLSDMAEKKGIEVVFGCTLVMLASGVF